MQNNNYRCFSCDQEEIDENKVVMCAYCYKCQHLDCKKVYGRAAEMLRQKEYFCSVDCSEIKRRCTSTIGDLGNIQLKDEFNKVFTEIQKVHSTMTVVQHTNVKLESKLVSLLDEVKAMKVNHDSLKDEVIELQQDHDSMNETVTGLQLELDRINRAALSKHAIIMGVPAKQDEVTPQVVVDIASALSYTLPKDAITEAKRIAVKDSTGKTPPIKVVFSDERFKEELFQKKKVHGLLLSSAIDSTSTGSGGSRIILRDELTSFGMKLLKDSRALQDQANVKFVWPGRNGVILAKANEGSKIETIRNAQDLRKLRRTHSKRQLDDSMLHSTAVEEPISKRHQP